MVIVTVGALHFHGFSVYKEDAVFDLDVAEADALGDGFDDGAIGGFECGDKGVKGGGFGGPEGGRSEVGGQASEVGSRTFGFGRALTELS